MIPPLPTINDAIGLLAALSDPDKTKAILEEAKGRVETANKMLADAQGAQRATDEERQSRAQERDEFGKQKVAFFEEKDRHLATAAKREHDLAEFGAALDAKEKVLNERYDAIGRSEAAVSSREVAADARHKALDAREGVALAREVKVESLMETLKPVMDMLK